MDEYQYIIKNNAFEILGVKESAQTTDAEVKNAYRHLAKEWHPHNNVGNEAARDGAKFRQIEEAYGNIATQEKREDYLRKLKAARVWVAGANAPAQEKPGTAVAVPPKNEVSAAVKQSGAAQSQTGENYSVIAHTHPFGAVVSQKIVNIVVAVAQPAAQEKTAPNVTMRTRPRGVGKSVKQSVLDEAARRKAEEAARKKAAAGTQRAPQPAQPTQNQPAAPVSRAPFPPIPPAQLQTQAPQPPAQAPAQPQPTRGNPPPIQGKLHRSFRHVAVELCEKLAPLGGLALIAGVAAMHGFEKMVNTPSLESKNMLWLVGEVVGVGLLGAGVMKQTADYIGKPNPPYALSPKNHERGKRMVAIVLTGAALMTGFHALDYLNAFPDNSHFVGMIKGGEQKIAVASRSVFGSNEDPVPQPLTPEEAKQQYDKKQREANAAFDKMIAANMAVQPIRVEPSHNKATQASEYQNN